MIVSALDFSYGGFNGFLSRVNLSLKERLGEGNKAEEELAADVGRLTPGDDPGIYKPYAPSPPLVKDDEITKEMEDEIAKIKKQNPNMDVNALTQLIRERLGVDISSSEVEEILKKKGLLDEEDQGNKGEEASKAAALGEKKGGLTEEEKAELERLKERDRQVRRHEQAHIALSGGHAQGVPQYEYEIGPDGRRYAVAGEVKIDMSPGRTPEETARKARAIERGALAPGGHELSDADKQVAQAARQMRQAAEKAAIAGVFQSESDVMTNYEEEVTAVREEDNRVKESNNESNDESKEASSLEVESPDVKEAESSGKLTEEEKKQVEELKKRDQEVRQHEQAHIRASGGHTIGPPRYEYVTGPDGRRYAVSGEVRIDMSKEDTPEETLKKAREIERAALAPSNPSPADRRVAAEARQMQQEARQEINEKKREELEARAEGKQENDGKDGMKVEENQPVSPEIERKIVEKKRENPGMDEKEIKKWLEETEGISIPEEKIKEIIEKEELNQNMDEERGFTAGIVSNIYKGGNYSLGKMLDLVA